MSESETKEEEIIENENPEVCLDVISFATIYTSLKPYFYLF